MANLLDMLAGDEDEKQGENLLGILHAESTRVKEEEKPEYKPRRKLDVVLQALHSKEDVDPPYRVVLNRFVASRSDLAPLAALLNEEVYDDAFVFAIWKTIFPRRSDKPRLEYAGPSKQDESDLALARQVARAYGISLVEAYTAVDVCRLSGDLARLRNYIGVEPDMPD